MPISAQKGRFNIKKRADFIMCEYSSTLQWGQIVDSGELSVFLIVLRGHSI